MDEELLQAIRAYDWGLSRAPLILLDAEIRKVLGHAEHVTRFEEGLVGVLESAASLAAKQAVCKRLGLIGTGRSVPALAAMLTDPATSDMARYALERIPGGEVDAALREALSRTSGRTRVGIINSLGNRMDAGAVPMLGRLIGDADEETARAAAWALGRIGGDEAARILGDGARVADGSVRLQILDACLSCADRLASEGSPTEAAAIYRHLSAEGLPDPIRRAASRGLGLAAAG